ncbi:MAG TPA: Lrp/AsnC family transcriptional regulator [Acidimicrobiia bacterium]|nr:Lrp/AsnC family transcriptional regulator [Acidimicrobiia bacterium]
MTVTARSVARANDKSVLALDEIDKSIVRHLQEDGRMSYADLGPAVGLSPAAARQRVLALLEAGAMQIVAVTDPTKMGFPVQAMVGFRVNGDLEAIAAEIARLPEVDYLVITTGRFDLLAEIVAEDNDHFLQVLSSIRTMPVVEASEAFTYLRLEKQSYDWGAR